MIASGQHSILSSLRLETDRFILKPMGYFEALRLTAPWRKDPEILVGLFYSRKPRSLRKWMRSPLMPRRGARYSYAIIAKATGKAIGAQMVMLSGHRSASFVVALRDRDWWGKGVVVEARAALIDHFIDHAGVERFFGTTEGRNLSSIYNYQRLGFNNVGAWRRHLQDPVSGEVFDLMMFELFRDDWRAGPFAGKTDGR